MRELLNGIGFDTGLASSQLEKALYLMRIFDAVVPMICFAKAICIIYHYPIIQSRVEQIRVVLEGSRGAA